MTETDLSVESTSTAPTPRRWPWVFALLVLFAITAALLWFLHGARESATERQAQTQQQEALEQQVAALEQRLDQIQRNQQGLSSRLDSASATNQVLREELLGMGERAALLEDSVARLTQSRAGSETVLRLNEAEFLLLIGGERLRLFGDTAGAVQAFSLAESALASLDDPQLATLRQTLAQELVALHAIPTDPRPQLRAELAALAQALPQLPVSREGEVTLDASQDSRFMAMLSRVVTVRRVDPATTVLGPAQRQAALAAIALKLELAQAALARPDAIAFAEALDQAQAAAHGLFDEAAPQTTQWFSTAKRLRETALLPELPVLGATLRELNALRASRSIAAPIRPLALPESMPAPAPEPAPYVPGSDESVEPASADESALEIEAPDAGVEG